MLSKKEALIKLRRYCAYQERCHSEVRTKILVLQIYGDQLEELISELIKEDFLNEQRFAEAYAGGKFRIKKWGKLKITQNLKKKMVSTYCINKGLATIEENEYRKALSELINKYRNKASIKDLSIVDLRKKCIQFCQRRGFEYHLINEVLINVLNSTNEKFK